AARPGVTGRELYDLAADVVEAAGHPTQRTAAPGETLTQGFYFGLGHGVGLEIHEAPALGLSGSEPLAEGDVVAVEPGIEELPGSFEHALSPPPVIDTVVSGSFFVCPSLNSPLPNMPSWVPPLAPVAAVRRTVPFFVSNVEPTGTWRPTLSSGTNPVTASWTL